MFYFVYQTKNLLNNKIYIGVHCTENINDGYLGSGKYLNRSIAKYGRENFERIILKFCNSLSEAYDHEKEIVNDDFVKRKDTYNLKMGGHGGWDHINSDQDKINQMAKHRLGELNGMFGKSHKKESIEKMKQNRKNKGIGKHSKEHILKRSQSKCLEYKVTSPAGEVTLTKNLKKFCEEFNLSYKTMSKIPLKNKKPTRGKCVGWFVEKL